MRKSRTDSVKGYKMDYVGKRIILNYKFNDIASTDTESPEAMRLYKICSDFPNFEVVVESGRKITTTRKNKRFTYKNMKKHIGQYENSEELITMFEKAKQLSKPLASPYKYVSDWFQAQFPDYKSVPEFKNGKLYILPVDVPNVDNYKSKEAA